TVLSEVQALADSFANAASIAENAMCTPQSALFASSNASASLMAVFGGNTGTTQYLDQAIWLVDVYGLLVLDFMVQMSKFTDAESKDECFVDVYADGLAIHKWIVDRDSAPEQEYLSSTPVSMPLIGLVQLMQLMVLYKTLGVSPGELAIATGHSQGIVSAVFLSTLTDDEESFISGSKKALGLLMLVGALPHLALPYFRLFEHGSNGLASSTNVQATPMVSVQGLNKQQLSKIIDDFNCKQPSANHFVQLAVANTVDQIIVAGQIEQAAKFARFAKSQSAAADQDQSKLLLALCKPVINIDYLGMTMPYHCDLLQDSAEDIVDIALQKGWTFDASDMQIAVRSNDNGHDICSESDLTRYLIESVCILPVDWPYAVNAPSITHAVYFGFDGLHGFAQFTYNNIEGRGIPVICAGVSAKNSRLPYLGTNVDLYCSNLANVTTAPNWLADFGPKLVCLASNNAVHINTKMHRIFGMPTV
ncbi:fatty acid synthase alpha subunit Lsd1, partial [Coemansia asiatica]